MNAVQIQMEKQKAKVRMLDPKQSQQNQLTAD
jgi:hypothetical protein